MDDDVERTAREALKKTEAGNAGAAETLDRERDSNPAAVDSVEQEASEAPEGRGLSR